MATNFNPIVCVAGGPSLTVGDLNHCREHRWRLAACNLSFRKVPDAFLFFANDCRWWRAFGDEALATLSKDCEIWTGCSWAGRAFGVKVARSCPEGAWPPYRGVLCKGVLSGYRLIQAAAWFKPSAIILLGYDHQHTGGSAHHHEDYGKTWTNADGLASHTHRYEQMAKEATIPVINASRETALTCFERRPLAEIEGAAPPPVRGG